jgi:hypothetical protein
VSIIVWDDDGEPVRLPSIKVVCPRCDGEGKHMNPSIDGHGISGDDECWDDDDFREGYFGGRYDVTCYECKGANVVDEIDEEACTPAQLELWEKHLQCEYEDRLIAEGERRMGA